MKSQFEQKTINSFLSFNSPRKRLSRKPGINAHSPQWKFSRLRCKSDQFVPMNYISPKKKKQYVDISSLIKLSAQNKLISLVQENQQLKEIVQILTLENQEFSEQLEVFRNSNSNFFTKKQQVVSCRVSQLSQLTCDLKQRSIVNRDNLYNMNNNNDYSVKNSLLNYQSSTLKPLDSNIQETTHLSTISKISQGKNHIFIYQENSHLDDQNTQQDQIRNLSNKQEMFEEHLRNQNNIKNSPVLQIESLVKIEEQSSQLNILQLTENHIQAQSILNIQSKYQIRSQINKNNELSSQRNYHQTSYENNMNNCQIPSFVKQSKQNSMYGSKKSQRKSRIKSRMMQLQKRQYFQTKDKQKKYLQDKVKQLSQNLKQANKQIAKLRFQVDTANINIQVLQHKLKVKQRLLQNLKAKQCQKIIFDISDGFQNTKSIFNRSIKQGSIGQRCQQLLSTYQAKDGRQFIQSVRLKINTNHQRTVSTGDGGGFGLKRQDRNKLKTAIKTKHDLLKNSLEISKSNSIISNFKQLCKQSYKNSQIASNFHINDFDNNSVEIRGQKQIIHDTLQL